MPYSFGGNNYKQQQFLANALMQSSQNNASPLASGLGAFAGALLSGKAADTQENDNKQLADMLMGAKTPQERINIAMGSSDPSIQKAGMAALLSNKQEQPYSTVGKIQADLAAGRIDPQTAQAALNKATTISPLFAGGMTPYQGAKLDFQKTQDEDRRTQKSYQQASDLSKRLEKSGVVDLHGNVRALKSILPPEGDVPGYGPAESYVPGLLVGEKGRLVRQRVAGVKNAILRAQSGQAVSESEGQRLTQQIEGAKTAKELRDAVGEVERTLSMKYDVIAAGVPPEAIDTYKKRGGVVIPQYQSPQQNDTIDANVRNTRPGSSLLPQRQPGQSLSEAAAGGGSMLPPALQNDPRVLKARQAGYSDEEIIQYIGGRQ